MKQLFLIFAFLIGYSLTASAEKIKLVPSAGDSTRMDTVVISKLSDADAYAPTDTHSNTNFSFFGDNMSNDMGGIIVLISVTNMKAVKYNFCFNLCIIFNNIRKLLGITHNNNIPCTGQCQCTSCNIYL